MSVEFPAIVASIAALIVLFYAALCFTAKRVLRMYFNHKSRFFQQFHEGDSINGR